MLVELVESEREKLILGLIEVELVNLVRKKLVTFDSSPPPTQTNFGAENQISSWA